MRSFFSAGTVLAALLAWLTVLPGCSAWMPSTDGGERNLHSGFTYIPIDPFPVYYDDGSGRAQPVASSSTIESLLRKLPDNAVRMSVEQFDARGAVTYGPVGVGVRGGTYRVTVDYINADTISFPVSLGIAHYASGARAYVVVTQPRTAPEPTEEGERQYGIDSSGDLGRALRQLADSPRLARGDDGEDPKPDLIVKTESFDYNIPVYVGIGLRVTADIRVLAGTANIAGLGALGLEAEANRLSGSLVVQTLGVNGPSISAALPIQSELNQTTTQNAIVAIGSIKALLYDADTVLTPRIVGIYLPFLAEDKEVVNQIISHLAREPLPWDPPLRIQQKSERAPPDDPNSGG